MGAQYRPAPGLHVVRHKQGDKGMREWLNRLDRHLPVRYAVWLFCAVATLLAGDRPLAHKAVCWRLLSFTFSRI